MRLAIWSLIGVPRKTIRSLRSSEYMSKVRSPRALVSVTKGIIPLGSIFLPLSLFRLLHNPRLA